MLSWREKHGADISSVRKLGFANAPMPDGLLQHQVGEFQPELFVNHYGSFEVFTFAYTQDATHKTGSSGRAGINATTRIVRLGTSSSDDQAALLEEGQIICELEREKAFEGYCNRPDANVRAIRAGRYSTVDNGYFNANGDLFVTGRVDDMIISGGENISPVYIESILSLHPAVDEVAVAGLGDERGGQRVVAFVKTRASISAIALDEHCKNCSLLNFNRLRQYVFVRDIPKSPVGKILRRKLVLGKR